MLIRSSRTMTSQPTRRPGLAERRLLTPEDTRAQNIVLLEAEEEALVEIHEIATSESLFVLEGCFEVLLDGESHTLAAGDLCHFPARTAHGLRCLKGPGRFLAIFAPSVSA